MIGTGTRLTEKWDQRLRESYLFFQIRPVPQMLIYMDTEEALEVIDANSRKYFPATFMLLMLVYWTTYLYIMPDIVYAAF